MAFTIENFPKDIEIEKLAEELSNAVKDDTVNNGKAGYQKLMPLLQDIRKKCEKDNKQLSLFADALDAVIDVMSIEIYEHYRAVVELRKEVKKEIKANKDAERVVIEHEDGTYLSAVYVGPRSASIIIEGEGPYNTKTPYKVYINGEFWFDTDRVVNNVYGLEPENDYLIKFVSTADNFACEIKVHTKYEYVTMNVKDFGAKGDGVTDDTHFIQAAIMACPEKSRVLIPAGTYKITSIFLKSNINIEVAKGATLSAFTEREKFAILPGSTISADERDEYNLGTWEGNPLNCFAGIICGINADNVTLYGEGVIDGCATHDNWWKNPKVMNIAFRPRLLFLNNCNNFVLQGLTLTNSPSWTIHPTFSEHMKFIGTYVKNPSNSPNTDGLDPESCKLVDIVGVRFSLGDDCIAIKSGKIYMGKKYKKPSEKLHIYQCLMENGHGAVTIGSECAGGVKEVLVENCKFSHTDRGLRVKTRRGRGNDGVLDEITFRNIEMDNVMSPFTANAFYFCDPDGKTDYVQSREIFPVDERTPFLKKFTFENINAKNCHVAALFFEGLPEAPIEEIVMKNINVNFCDNPTAGQPIMSSGIEECTKRGIHVKNVKKLTLERINIEGYEGDLYEISGCEELIEK